MNTSETLLHFSLLRELTGLWRMANHAGDLGLAMLMGGGVRPDPSLDSAAYQSAYKRRFFILKKTGSYGSRVGLNNEDF
jgi:hypothetical protein